MFGAAACLAAAIYFEARNQPVAGQYAVAEVIMNRVESPKFPNTVCGVVKQDKGPKKHDCQFSFWCDGKPENMRNKESFWRAVNISVDILDKNTTFTKGALYYHATSVKPGWSRRLKRTTKIGDHIFYK